MLSHDDVIRKFEAHREAASAPTSPDLFAPDARQVRCEVGQWVTVIDRSDCHHGCLGRVDYRNASRVVVKFPVLAGHETGIFTDSQLRFCPELNAKLNYQFTPALAPDKPADKGAFDAAVAKQIEAEKAAKAAWVADANELLGLLTMASKDSDVNHVLTLTLIGRLREHINRA